MRIHQYSHQFNLEYFEFAIYCCIIEPICLCIIQLGDASKMFFSDHVFVCSHNGLMIREAVKQKNSLAMNVTVNLPPANVNLPSVNGCARLVWSFKVARVKVWTNLYVSWHASFNGISTVFNWNTAFDMPNRYRYNIFSVSIF